MKDQGLFHGFCAGLDTPGGHMIMGVVMIIVGGVFSKFQIPHGSELIVSGIMLVGVAAKGQNGKGAGIQPAPPATEQK